MAQLYKIFAQDRLDGMYSCFKDVHANSIKEALKHLEYPRGYFKAIPWPAVDSCDKAWLERYVGVGLTEREKQEVVLR